MKAPFSPYLAERVEGIRSLIAMLRQEYDYVSVLSTDSVGFAVRISRRAKSVSRETMTTERGHVVRVCKDGLYSEAAFNRFDPDRAEETAAWIRETLNAQLAVLRAAGGKLSVCRTPVLPDEPETLLAEMETGRLPENEDMQALIGRLSAISDAGMARGEGTLDCGAAAQCTHISKMFQTEHRDLRQSYVYAEGSVSVTATRDGKTEVSHESVSGRCGPELFDDLTPVLQRALKSVDELLDARRVEPGEYDIITMPDVTGLIAHEAFGHGVEMDMFVKNRALGAAYIGKRVGSDLVTMHEGALCAVDVTSYAFDDEGTPAGDVTEIDHGILRTGICDALSALRLGVAPTGNGKRQNYAHKVYTRMTNTLFDSGESTLEEMIASVQHGYLLSGIASGMEDPKHWGIQCIVEKGYEIRDGRLTGVVIAPVVMTGYVPDLLGSVSMVSRDREVFGAGGCGKGYKEWVKVADGGPCLKARAMLG
ncbi:MAG: TldD/PmbA family protein [Clostridia bacterium]|nr:TldD/PmbA family protein [Clostridia bacterium]